MTKVTLAQEKDVQAICNFIRQSYLPELAFPDRVLIPWVTWYCQKRFCTFAYSSQTIQSLLLGRACDRQTVDQAMRDSFFNHPKGDCFYVDTIISPQLCLIYSLAEVMMGLVGAKEYIAFKRDHGKMDRVGIYHTHAFIRRYKPRIQYA